MAQPETPSPEPGFTITPILCDPPGSAKISVGENGANQKIENQDDKCPKSFFPDMHRHLIFADQSRRPGPGKIEVEARISENTMVSYA
jgi:hypothetical protein